MRRLWGVLAVIVCAVALTPALIAQNAPPEPDPLIVACQFASEVAAINGLHTRFCRRAEPDTFTGNHGTIVIKLRTLEEPTPYLLAVNVQRSDWWVSSLDVRG